jgi:chromosome segregation ATPase
MSDELTVSEAAQALGTSGQTIRTLLGDGTLTGRRGPRNAWLVDRVSVASFLGTRGPLNGQRRRKSRAAELEDEVNRLRAEVDRLTVAVNATGSGAAALQERDALRARVVELEDGLAQMRDAAELQRRAETERSELVDHLLAAVASADRADALRREAVEKLEDALARTRVPGHPGV